MKLNKSVDIDRSLFWIWMIVLCGIIVFGLYFAGTMGDIVMKSNQCPVCEKVLAKSGSRYHLVRHMKAKHGNEDPESMLNMALGDEGKEKQKGPNLKTTPRKYKVPSFQTGGNNEKKISKSVGLCITASDAKNELIAEGSSEVKAKEEEPGEKSTYKKGTQQSGSTFKDADCPRRPMRPQLFVPKFKDINQREAEFVSQRKNRMQEVKRVKKEVGKDIGVQTEMIWDDALKEIEYCIRISNTLCTLKTAEELFRIGIAECPRLDRDILRSIIKSQYPMGQVVNVGLQIEEEEKMDGSQLSTSKEYATKIDENERKNSAEYSTILEEDLKLSDSNDDSSLIILYSSSEEEED